MSSNFWLLVVESRDFSQAEIEKNVCQADQIHKMTTFFTQNDDFVLPGSSKSDNFG